MLDLRGGPGIIGGAAAGVAAGAGFGAGGAAAALMAALISCLPEWRCQLHVLRLMAVMAY